MTVDIILNQGSRIDVIIDRTYTVNNNAVITSEIEVLLPSLGIEEGTVYPAGTDIETIIRDLITDSYYSFLARDVATDIYVYTTGNDATGDGSVGSPYLTINRALKDIGNNAILSAAHRIIMDLGTFQFTDDDQSILNSISIIDGGSLNSVGVLVLEVTGLTLTPDGSNPFLYDITGGTLVSGANKGHLILEGGTYYPIQSNTTNQLIAQDRIGSSIEIYSIGTTIQLENLSNLSLETFAYQQGTLMFENLIFDGDTNIRNSASFVSMYNCNVNGDIGVSANGKLDFESGSVFGKINSSSVRLFLFHFNIDAGGTTNYPLQTSFGVTVLRGGLFSNPSSNYCIFAKDSDIYNNNGTAGKDRGICFINATTAIYLDSASFDSKSANTVQLDTITNIVDSDDYVNISLSIPTLSGSPSGNIRADASTDYIELVDKTYINVDSAETNVRVKNEFIVEERSKAGAYSIAYSAVISVDFNRADIQQIAEVTGNLTINTTEVENNQTGVITFTIDSTGGYTIASGSGTWQKYDDSAYDFADCNVADTVYHVFYVILNSTIYYSIQAVSP